MQKFPGVSHSWRELLAAPPAAAHVLQLYDRPAFLASAVAHFAAEGIAGNEALLLTGTQAHLAAIRASLDALGVRIEAAEHAGLLVFHDVYEAIEAVLRGGRLDAEAFRAAAREKTAAMRAAGARRIRWWGEMSNTLLQRGDAAGAMLSERLAHQMAREQGLAIFCSYCCDKFDPAGYGGIAEMCDAHSHVIPAEDYAGYRLAVNRAIAEVVGEIRGSLLQSLSSWQGVSCELPSSQAVLFWLRESLPERFEAVLARARAHHESAERRAA